MRDWLLSRTGSRVREECTFGASDKRATVEEQDDEESKAEECEEEVTTALTFLNSLICPNPILQFPISVERSDPDLPNFLLPNDG
jgi:hypothetical protein